MPNAVEQAVYVWVAGVLVGVPVFFAEQPVSAPRAIVPHAVIQVVSETTLAAMPAIKTTTTPSGNEFVRRRGFQSAGVARVDAFGDGARAKIKALEQSITTIAGQILLKTAGIVAKRPISNIPAFVKRDNRWERRQQADFPIAFVDIVDDTGQAIETVVAPITANI